MSSQITMDLENLRKQYSNLLIKYKAADAEYNAYLNEQNKSPCKKFSLNTRGDFDDDCVNYIFKKSGCGTGSLKPTANDVRNLTLIDLIFSTWQLATSNDEVRRKICYGTSTKYNTSTAPDYNINSQSFATIKGMAFPGTGEARSRISQNQTETLQDCIALCNSSPECTGANFVSKKCSIRTGDSPLVASSPDSYAIIPKEKMLLLNMEDINKQMLNINAKIEKIITSKTYVYEKTNKESQLKNKELIDNYEKLLDERRSIAEKLNEFETLDNTENENQIIVTKNYYTYILLIILAIGMIIFFYRMVGSRTSQYQPIIHSGGELGTSAYYIVFGLIIFIVILRWSLNYLTL
jgi:hypothetical protein